MTEEITAATPAYLPFRTFMNTIDTLAANMPNRIDKTAFPGQSGGAQNQLMLAFKFFGLISDDGKPTATMYALAVTDEGARKIAFKKLIEDKYAALISLNLMKTTPAEFAEKMAEVYGISGDTRLKATRFFLNAAEYLGIQVSQLLQRDKTKTIGAPTTTRKRRARVRVEEDEEEDEEEPGDGGSAAAESRSVELRSGGTLTLSSTSMVMALSAADRKFVIELLDKLEEYEAQANNG